MIFHVRLPSSIQLGYDSYSEFVCIASSEKEARETYPGGFDEWPEQLFGEWIEKDQIDKLVVTCIGVAHQHLKAGVICASYHAG